MASEPLAGCSVNPGSNRNANIEVINLPQHSFAPDGYAGSMFSAWMRNGADVLRPERNRALIAVGISVLFHLALLLATIHQRIEPPVMPGWDEHEPLTVRLAPPVAAHPPAAKPAVVPPPPKAAAPKPPKVRKHTPVIRVPKSAAPAIRTVPEPVAPPAPPVAQQAQPMDMMSMVQAARERRRAAEEAAARENAEARMAEKGPSRDDIAMANVQHSLQAAGRKDRAGGVFQVVSKGVRTGTFIFRGWTPGQRRFPQQTFEVDAGPNGDVERALVRRMIELIRSHYDGDFNWDSHRLGRVVVKSARKEDSAELEAFLMKEFFGDEDSAGR
jgi:hypothetical protein